VTPNKIAVKEAVYSAYKQVLSEKSYNLSAKEISQLAEKSSSRTIELLVTKYGLMRQFRFLHLKWKN